MSDGTILRRAFLGTMAALPATIVAQQPTIDPSGAGIKVAAGEGRFRRTLKLPDGGVMFIKVATQDTGGAFFLTEQPSGRKGGPPKHFHLEEDEWFYFPSRSDMERPFANVWFRGLWECGRARSGRASKAA